MVLQVCADTRQVGDDGNVEFVQFLGRTNTIQLEKLRGVVSTSSDDDFTRCFGRSGGAERSGLGSWAGLVKILTVQELNTSGTGRVLGLIKSNLSDMAVHADIEGIFLATNFVLSVPNSNNKLASDVPVGVIS